MPEQVSVIAGREACAYSAAEIRNCRGVVVVRCRGQVLLAGDVDAVARKVRGLSPYRRRVVVNLRKMTKFGKGDLGLLWMKYLEARASGWRVALAEVPAALKALLHEHEIAEVFETYARESEAVEALSVTCRIIEIPAERRVM